MGHINEYQRKQLTSSLTGVPAQDTSGRILGESVMTLGAALTQRQDALDTAEVSKAFYRYVAADTLQIANLQKEYMSDPDIDPLTFTQKYEERTGILAQQFKEKLPDRVQGKFDVLVERQKAQQAGSNVKWVMDLQNRNALEGFQSLGEEFNLIAGQTVNAPEFLKVLSSYDDGALGFKAIASPASFNSTTKAHQKNMALSHINGRMDIDNGGNPVALWQDLSQNKEYRQKLSSILGETSLQGMEKNLDKAIVSMGIDRGFKKTMADDASLIDITNKLFAQDNGYGLSDMENLYQMESRFLTSMKNGNIKGVNDAAIEQSEKTLKVYEDLLDIARYTNDVSYVTKPETKSELIAEINLALSPFQETKTKKKLAGTEKDLLRQHIAQGGDVPFSIGGLLTGRSIWKGSARAFLDTTTGIPRDIRAEKEENIKAGRTASEYMKELYEVKGKILAARKEKKITSADARELIAKYVAPLSNLNSYDTVQMKGKNWFTTGYNAFNDYVKDQNLRGNADENRTVRDTMKAQMMSRLATQVSLLGTEPTDDFVTGAIMGIKNAMNKQRHPSFANAKPGDVVMYRNRPVEFTGFDSNTGEPITKVPGGLQEAVDNT